MPSAEQLGMVRLIRLILPTTNGKMPRNKTALKMKHSGYSKEDESKNPHSTTNNTP